MTRRLYAPYFAKRYIGDSDTKILHDLDVEKRECLIDIIPKSRIQMFEWLSIPTDLGYGGCKHCMPDYKGASKSK
ncbi:MAG: hypothetical protein ACYC7D_01420 [Nitrososphaerales archaeon]